MKTLVILTFDLIRRCDPPISLAAGYLLVRLKADPGFANDFTFKHISFNLLSEGRITAKTAIDRICESVDLNKTDCIALSCYAWCDYLVNDLVSGLRDRGFRGALVLGGYGGGVLKVEPGESCRALLVYPKSVPRGGIRSLSDMFDEVDTTLRRRGGEVFSEIDDIVLRGIIGLPTTDVKHLQNTYESLRERRLLRSK